MPTPVLIDHLFQSLKADGPDPTLVRPSNWNAHHKVTGGADGQLVVFDSTSATGLGFAPAVTAALINNAGGALAVGDVVAVSLAADGTVVLSDVVSSALQFVVSLATPANLAAGPFGTKGPLVGVKAQGAIPAGNYVRKSATTKAVEDTGVVAAAGTPPPAGALGIATTVAAAGLVNVWWFGATTVAVTPPPAAIYTDELTGLITSFSSATVLGVATGAAASDDATIANRVMVTLASAFTKSLSAWAVGTGNGGMASGAGVAASTAYHVFLIQRPDTGVVDVAFDTSPTGANLGANTNAAYTKKRRIGSFRTNGSSQIPAFTQVGNQFLLSVPVLDVDSGDNPGATALTKVLTSIPTGVVMEALTNVVYVTSGVAVRLLYMSPLFTTDAAPTATAAPGGLAGGAADTSMGGAVRCLTDTAASVRVRISASVAGDHYYITTRGWIDSRGRGV